jgi:hypothetical protein
MKTVKIIRLDIENFKGIRKFTVNLGGKSASIYGDNATGKTSVYDALTWLLFGKDSHGNSKFDIKPLNDAGNTIVGVMPTVSAELVVNGVSVVLKKILREKWEKHRGGEERYGGNTVDYYINDVPTKERQYKLQIEALVASEEVFRVLTNTYRFCRDTNWKERREVLFDIAGIGSDADILAEPGFDGLREELDGRSIDDFRSMLVVQRKDANTKLNLLPARIDECERQLSGLPDFFDSTERDRIVCKIENLREKLVGLDSDEGRQRIKNEINAVILDQTKLDMENEQHRRSQSIPVQDARPILCEKIQSLKDGIAASQRVISNAEMTIMRCTESIGEARKQWKRLNKQKFQPGVCHACGQPLPADRNAAMQKAFEQDIKDRKQALEEQSKRDKITVAETKKAKQEAENKLSEDNVKVNALQAQLSEYRVPEQEAIEDLPEYREARTGLESKLNELRSQLMKLDADKDSVRRQLQDQLQDQIEELTRKKAVQDRLEAQFFQRRDLENRIEDLVEQQRTKAEFIDHIDDLLEQCEAFVQVKVARVSDAVNAQFSLCTWRLFTEAINGNLQDCCDALVDGVPYNALNSAMQINVGLDVIQTISNYYGLRVPLFVDNAESITKLNHLDTQVVRLVVSERDKDMRIEQ